MISPPLACPFSCRILTSWLVVTWVATFFLIAVAAGQIEGFIEPFRSIELSSDESGAIAELNVTEGDFVQEDFVVCRLDTSVQEIQLEIARHLADSTSQVRAAEQTYDKRLAITERIRELCTEGHATDSELIRSEMELSIANARLLAAQEDATIRRIEYRRAVIQLERRAIRAPFTGVVSKILRREGEFVSPLHPELVTLVQVDRLLATFNVPSSQIQTFEPGREFELALLDGQVIQATVHCVGVTTEAQSGTVEIKLVIENQNNELRAGELVTLKI